MNAAQRYIQEARNRKSQQYHNFIDDASNPYNSFVAQPALPYMNQSGAVQQTQQQEVRPSMPYSLIISSASGASVQNFDIFGASEYLNNPNVTFNANGDLVQGSITISSNTTNITYRDLLYQSITANFSVGQVYLQCSSPSTQISQPYTIFTKDGTGVRVQVPIKPKKDPYQNQNDVVVDNTVFRMDALTKLTFSQILPLAVLFIDLYPQDNVNPGRLLNGQNPTKFYGNPNTIRSSIAVVPSNGASNFSGPMIIKSRM